MKNTNYLLTTLIALASMYAIHLSAQVDIQKLISYPFDKDSLYGFNEEQAIQEGLSNNCTSRELKYFLYLKKREFIIQKYNLQRFEPTDYLGWSNKNYNPSTIQTVACNNEDFELGNFTGWVVNQGSNSNSCTMTGCCTGGMGLAAIFTTPGANPYGGPLTNIPNSPLGGTKVALLNNNTAGAKAVRIEKTFNVTPSNALFQFAFLAVLQNPSHSCCQQPYLKVSFLVSNGCTGAPTPTSCPSFSIVPPTSGCSTSFSGWSQSGSIYYTPNWIQSSVDLTSLIGSCVTIQFTVGDCILTGHYGYALIDCLCSPMDIIGNGNTFPAGTPSIVLPTCGSSSATIIAPPGLGPYNWQGPSGFSSTSQTITTGLTGDYTLTMNPPGSCSPITKIITVTITPNPAIQANVVQPTCNNPTATASATCSLGTGTYNVTWSPTPASSGTVTANTFSASGLVAGSNTVTVTDGVGCTASQVFTVNPAPPIPTFTISLSDDTLTCYQPTVSASAVNTNTDVASPSYTFTSVSSGTFSGNPYTVSAPDTYTVLASDPSTGCIYTNTFAVGIFTTVPTVTVSPNSLNIPCTGSAGTFTGTSNPTVNVSYSWLQPGNPPVPLSGNILTPGSAGTYTFVATDIASGCSNTFTVSVTQSTAAPTMTVQATNNNYDVKCSPTTVTLVVNATQAPGGGAPLQYWTDASGTTTLTTSNTFTTNTPGNYICWVYDPAPGGCIISQTITVGIDTLKPVGGYTLDVPTNTLNCYYPNAIITGTSAVSGASYIWYTPGSVPQQTISVSSTTNTSQTTIGTYTVEVTDPNNGCKRLVPVTIYQDKQPLGLTAKATPSVLTCKDLEVTLQFTPNPISEPLTFTWTTPSPTSTNNVNNPVTFYSSGDYTLCATKNSNGCQSCTVVLVGSNTTPPSTVAAGPYTISCGYTNTTIYAGTTPSTNITYAWDGPPGATITPVTGYSPTVSSPGDYIVVITNTTTGCASQNQVTVINGTIDASFVPDPSEGYAPLGVSFTNNSFYGNPSNLTYYWSFGNGGTVTTVANTTVTTPGTSTTYDAPGTYTVMMVMQNGTCVDTAYRVIKVDIPSDMEVPNVFTPNGDGVNDYFIVHATNITEIECLIIDRWGVEMYNVSTDKGNIQWDGKTKGGKDAPTGTYYYTIKAKGKDDKTYEKKGFLTLLR